MITIIDALESALDGDISAKAAEKLSKAQRAELVGELRRFHEEWKPPELRGDEYRVSLGFCIGERQNVTALVMRPDEIRGPVSHFHTTSRRMFASAFVYGDSVVTHDPTSDLDPSAKPVHFIETIEYMGRLAPLVRCGGLILAPVLEEVWRNAHRRLRDQARELEVIHGPVLGFPDPDALAEHWDGMIPHSYLTFLIDLDEAAHCRARFLPSDEFTWRNLTGSIDHVQRELRGSKVELKVVPSLAAAQLPILEGVAPSTLTKIREDDEAFAEWRAVLRSVVRNIEETPFIDPDFEIEARSAISDALEPAAAAVRRSMAKSRVLRRHAKKGLGRIILGGALLGGVSVMDGAGIAETLASTAAGAVSTTILDVLFGQRPQGALAVLSRLVMDLDRRS
jgi:hypothetical protein